MLFLLMLSALAFVLGHDPYAAIAIVAAFIAGMSHAKP
jgi:hypothetical protein